MITVRVLRWGDQPELLCIIQVNSMYRITKVLYEKEGVRRVGDWKMLCFKDGRKDCEP